MTTSASGDTAVSAGGSGPGTAVRPGVAALTTTGLGLLAVIAGTFLPWLSSGGIDRNSYAITGVVTRLGFAGTGFGATALSWWPLLGPVAMLAVVAGILRWWRTGALISLLYGVLTGVIGGGVLAVAGGRRAAGVTLAYPGPVVTVIGALAAVAGSIMMLGRWRRRGSGDVVDGSRSNEWCRENPVSTEPGGGSSRLSNHHQH